ncbi:MAG: hypothetical protein ACI9SE_000592 [Neolewinella sp.]|jgi:hypothetical protein
MNSSRSASGQTGFLPDRRLSCQPAQLQPAQLPVTRTRKLTSGKHCHGQEGNNHHTGTEQLERMPNPVLSKWADLHWHRGDGGTARAANVILTTSNGGRRTLQTNRSAPIAPTPATNLCPQVTCGPTRGLDDSRSPADRPARARLTSAQASAGETRGRGRRECVLAAGCHVWVLLFVACLGTS